MIVPREHLSQMRTLELHKNLCNNHHRGILTTLQRVRSTNLLQNLSRKTNLVFLEALNTSYVLILNLNFQKYTDIDVCGNLFSAPSVRNLHFLSLLFSFLFISAHTSFPIFLFWGQIHIKTKHQQNKYNMHKQRQVKTKIISCRIFTRKLYDWSQPISHQGCRHTMLSFCKVKTGTLSRAMTLLGQFFEDENRCTNSRWRVYVTCDPQRFVQIRQPCIYFLVIIRIHGVLNIVTRCWSSVPKSIQYLQAFISRLRICEKYPFSNNLQQISLNWLFNAG